MSVYSFKQTDGTETDQTPKNNRSSDVESVDRNWYLEYPPETLDQLVREVVCARSFEIEDRLSSWLPFWAESERTHEALRATECHVLSNDRNSNETVLAVRNVGGLSRNYPWRVRAQQSNRGWMEYWSSYEETQMMRPSNSTEIEGCGSWATAEQEIESCHDTEEKRCGPSTLQEPPQHSIPTPFACPSA